MKNNIVLLLAMLALINIAVTINVDAYSCNNLLYNATLDEGSGTSVRDYSQLNLTGTFCTGGNTPEWNTTGYNGSAIFFGSTNYNDCYNITSGAGILNLSSGFTTMAWALHNGTSTYMYLFDRTYLNDTSGHVFRNYLMDVNKNATCVVRTTSNYYTTQSSIGVTINTWTHVACVYNVSHINVYVNGVLRGQTATSGVLQVYNTTITVGDNFMMNTQGFIGRIDEPKIFNTTLTAAEIQGEMAHTNTDCTAAGGGGADTTSPSVTLVSPSTGNNTEMIGTFTDVQFNCTATDGVQLANFTLWTNITGSWTANNTLSRTGTYNTSQWTLGLQKGTYLWNCRVCDNSSNCDLAASNFTMNVRDTTKPLYANQGSNATSVLAASGILLYARGYDLDLHSALLQVNTTIVDDYPDEPFTKLPGNPVLGYSGTSYVGVPDVIKIGSTYHMYYESQEDAAAYQMWYANSTDGITWSKHYQVLWLGSGGTWDDAGITNPHLVWANSTYLFMYYVGHDGTNAHLGLVYTTTDRTNYLINWTRWGVNNCGSSGNGCVIPRNSSSNFDSTHATYPSAMLDNGTWKMWYTGNNGTMEEIGYANSTDGITWVKWPTNPIFTGSANLSLWDARDVINAYVQKIGNVYFMTYNSKNNTGNWKIGYANSTDGITWTRSNKILIEASASGWDDGYVAGQCILNDTTDWKMWYEGYTASPQNWTIGFANLTLSASGGEAWVNYSSQLLNTSTWTWSNFTWANASQPTGTTVKWRIVYNDTTENTNTTAEMTFNIMESTETTPPTVTLINPSSGNYTEQSGSYTNIPFNCTATDGVQLANATLFGNWSGWHANNTASKTGTYNQSTWTIGLPPGTYIWNCMWGDNSSNYAFAGSNYTFTIRDSLSPYFRNQGSNQTSIIPGGDVLLYAEGYDINGVNTASLYTNESGSDSAYPNSTWTKYASNPLYVNGTRIGAPEIYYDGSSYHMFYESIYAEPTGYERLWYANSTDGITWNVQGLVFTLGASGAFDDIGMSNPSIVKVNSTTWFMYYVGQKSPGGIVGIGLAWTDTSRGNYFLNWTRWPQNTSRCDIGTGPGCVFNGTQSGFSIKSGYSFVTYPAIYMKSASEWHMLYIGENGSNQAMGYANSTNGLDWIAYASNPVITGDGTGYDSNNILMPFIINTSSNYYVFYTGTNSTGNRAISITQTTDFITYTYKTAIIIPSLSYESAEASDTYVTYNSTYWKLWYVGYNGSASSYSINYATHPYTSSSSYTKRSQTSLSNLTTWTWSNFTWSNASVSEKTISWYILYNDTSGNNNQTGYMTFQVTSSLDTTSPDISWNSPTNNSQTSNSTQITYNVTVSETGGSTILNVNGTTNYTMSWSGSYAYYTLTGSNQTMYCGRVYANDTAGNLNLSDMRCVTVNLYSAWCGDGTCNGGETCSSCPGDCGSCGGGDTTPPDITWNVPSSNNTVTQNISYISWNVSLSEVPGTCYLTINGSANITMSKSGYYCYYNSTSLTNQTTYCGRVYGSDASGNYNLTSSMCSTINLTSSPTESQISIYVYDEDDYDRIYNFTANFITLSGTKTYGINSSLISGAGYDNPYQALDTISTTPSRLVLQGAGTSNYTLAGRVYIGDSQTLCVSWNMTSDTSTSGNLYVTAEDSTGTLTYIGNKSWSSTSSQASDCFPITPSNYPDMIEVNVTAQANLDGFVDYLYLFEVYPGTFNLTGRMLTINSSWLDAGSNRIDISDEENLYYGRTYYATIGTNITLNAYLPPKTESIVQSIFVVMNQYGNYISGASLAVQKLISSNYTNIAQMETDSTGSASVYLIENDPYRVVVTYGSSTQYYTFNALAQTYPIVINASLEVNFTDTFDDISMYYTPQFIAYNSSLTSYDQDFSFTISSNKSALTSYGVTVVCNGTTSLNVTNQTTASGGTINITEDIAGCENITMSIYFEKNGEVWWKDIFYKVSKQYSYGLRAALELFQGNFSNDVKIFILIIALMLVGSALVGFHPEAATLANIIVLGIFVYMDAPAYTLTGFMVVIAAANMALLMIKRRWL